nr:hypothetical protein [Mesorhizobium huakuii]
MARSKLSKQLSQAEIERFLVAAEAQEHCEAAHIAPLRPLPLYADLHEALLKAV